MITWEGSRENYYLEKVARRFGCRNTIPERDIVAWTGGMYW